jgi:dienelactone hydrolase
MRVRATVRFWGANRVVVQGSPGWRVLAWPSAQRQAEGAGVFVPGPGSRWATVQDGLLRLAGGRVVEAPGVVSDAAWDGPDALLAVVDGQELWRLGGSADTHLLFSRDGIRRPQPVDDRIGFEREFSAGMPGVILDAWDVCRFFTVDRAGGTVEDPAPRLAGWLYHVAPSPATPARLAFGHTELPCPYTWRVGLLIDGVPHFPFPGDVRTGADPVWSPDGSAVATVGMQGLSGGIVTCDPDGLSWQWLAPAQGLHTSPVPLPGGEALSIWQDLNTPPAVVHTTPRERLTWAQLLEPPQWWPTVPVRLIRWRSGTDELEGLLATPPGGGPYPMVVDLHGGPDGMTIQASLQSYAVPLDSWVRAGFAVFAPDYRESGILGLAAKRAATRMEPGWRASHDDVIAGIDHLVAEGIADPSRMYLFGFSMGGLVGGHVIARDDRIRTAAFWDPAGIDFRMVDNALARRQFGGSPDEVPHVWDRVSLLPLAARTRTPVLLMSAGDPDSPPNQAHARWHALLPTSQHLSFPHETHTPSPAMRAEIVRRATAWFTPP